MCVLCVLGNFGIYGYWFGYLVVLTVLVLVWFGLVCLWFGCCGSPQYTYLLRFRFVCYGLVSVFGVLGYCCFCLVFWWLVCF